VRDPLIPPLAALAAGILLGRFAGLGAGDAPLACGAFVLLGAVALWRGARLLAGVCCLLGLTCAGAWLEAVHRPGPAPELDAESREVVVVAGCVVDPPAASGDRERFIVELEPGARAQVTLYTRGDEPLPRLEYGQMVEVEARVRRPRNFRNPGAFDYTRFLARQDIYWTISAPAGAVTPAPGRCGSELTRAVMALRTAAAARIEQLYAGQSYNSGMMLAILLGQTFQLHKVWTEEYRATGTFHALVISGTHVAVLAGFLLFLLRLCFVPRGVALAVTVAMAWVYAAVTGWQAPCVRSAAGMALVAAATFFYRERRVLNLLAAVAIGYLVLDPGQLFEPSFQLTFLAVACIGAFGQPLIEATSGPLGRALGDLGDAARDIHLEPRCAQFRIEMRLLIETLRLGGVHAGVARLAVVTTARVLFFLWEVVAISATVQAGLALPMVVYFHRVGVSGLSANALVVPLMGLVVPAGFVAVFTGWRWVADFAGGLLWMSQKVVAWHAQLEPAWRIPTPPLWLGIALAGAFLAAACLRGRWRAAAAAAVAALVAVLLWHPFPPQVAKGVLEVSAIDVGQGDSILVGFPDGRLLLIDGGGIATYGKQSRPRLDIGEDVVAPYLWTRSIRRIDAIALTHAHEDHIGGLPALIEAFRPRELWTGATPESPTWAIVREKAAKWNVRIVPLEAPARFEFGGATIDVLAPPEGYVPAEVPKNHDSLAMAVRHGRHRFMLSGDVERQSEWRMVDGGRLGRADVLKVAHHGSRTSTTEDFLNQVRPAIALISVGRENSYGHPHPSVIERLAGHAIAVLRTDRDGLVSVRSDGTRLTAETDRWVADDRAGLMQVF
jgi:competence protein ComEC